MRPEKNCVWVVALCAAMAGCATIEPTAYTDIESSAYLAPNAQDGSGRIPYRYSAQVDFRRYNRIIIEPVKIYRGTDHQFGNMPEADRQALADYMRDRFAEKLKPRFEIVTRAAPDVLRLKLTLTGATANTPVLGTLSRFDLAGGVYNGVQQMRDREGTLTGSVMYAVEIHDAGSRKLLTAFVAKQYPKPYDIGASVGPLAAAKVGIDKAAEDLLAQLQ